MRLLNSLLLASTCIFSSLSASDGATAAAPDNDETCVAPSRTHEVYTMGFEAETSVFKMKSDTPKQVFSDEVEGKTLWAFTVDTPDYSVKTLVEEGNLLNTECKTIDGLTKEEIQEAARRVRFVWQKIKAFCKDKYDSFVVIPENAFEVSPTPSFEIRMPNAAPHQIAGQVYPQLTYCLPLSQLRLVFNRIAALTTLINNDILEFVNKKTLLISDVYPGHSFEQLENERQKIYEVFEDNEKKRSETLLELEVKLQQLLDDRERTKTKDLEGHITRLEEAIKSLTTAQEVERMRDRIPLHRISTVIMKRTQNDFMTRADPILNCESSPGSGLAYLFAFYAYQLFCNNLASKELEPGPKPFLGVMSRLPFTELFNGLNSEEQGIFKSLIENNLYSFFGNNLRRYKTAVSMQLNDRERITLGQWYESIVFPAKRINNRDLMSPPPGCRLSSSEEPYGMGAYGGKGVVAGHALIEVRAYSKLAINRAITTLDNFIELIKNESEWFFNHVASHGESQ